MSETSVTIKHVRVESEKKFEEVSRAFEARIGKFDPHVLHDLAPGGDLKAVRARLEAMAGPSGFMLFNTQNHGTLLRLAGKPSKVTQYVVGNPLYALEMTRHDVRAALYAPLRVLIYQAADGKTYLEYDRPSSLFGQFGNERVAPMAAALDKKLDDLVAAAR